MSIKIAVSYDIVQNRNDWKTYVAGCLRKLGHEVNVHDIREQSLCGYDLHLDIDSSTNLYIAEPNCKTIYWAFDAFQTMNNGNFLRSDFYIARSNKADIVWSASTDTKNNLANHGILSDVVLPGYIDFDINYIQHPSNFVTYIGGGWWFDESINGKENRTLKYLNYIKSKLGDGVRVSNNVIFEDVYKLYADSYVVFNHTTCAANHLSNRVYEALVTGACLITNYVQDLELIGLVDGTDYLSYDDERSLSGILDSLVDKKMLRAIGYCGQQKIIDNFATKNILAGKLVEYGVS